MRVKFLLISLLLTIVSNAYTQKKVVETKWLEKVVNPESGQLPRQEYSYHNKSKILYLITNDEDYLYLDLIVPEQSAIRNILETGLKVWIDVTAKNKKHLGIRFPIPIEKTKESPNQSGNNSRPSNNGQRPETPSLDQNMQIELIGFANTDSYFIEANEKDNINGHINFNKYKELTYHLTIPFDNLYGVSLVGQIISLNIVSNQASSQSNIQGGQNGKISMQESPSRGRGGMQGRDQGSPSGQGGMRAPQSQSLSSNINIKIKKMKIVSQS